MEDRIDIRMALEMLGTGWAFGGSVTDGTEACWNAVSWEDARPKPTWAELQDAAAVRAIDVQLAAIDAQFEARLGSIRTAMVLADLADGANMETKKASLRAEWQAVTNEKAASIMAILEGI